MPRDGSGTYTRPSSTTAVAGAPITSVGHNAILTDLETEITGSVPIAGTKAMTGPMASSNANIYSGGAAAAAGVKHELAVLKTGIADNTATAVITVTVPNAAHNAGIFLDIVGYMATGTDASESTRVAIGSVTLARTAGADTVAVVSTIANGQIATVAAGGTITLAYSVSAMTGASSATQTFNILVTIVVTGTITTHGCLMNARLLNAAATGVTMAAA